MSEGKSKTAMATAPILLDEYIDTASILPLNPDGVKQLPAQLTCPKCSSDSNFIIYKDPTAVKGTSSWGNCISCGLRGGPIQIFKAQEGLTTTGTALDRLSAGGWFRGDLDLAYENIPEYDGIISAQEHDIAFFEESHKALMTTGTRHPVLINFQLHTESNLELLGATNKDALDALLDTNSKVRRSPLLVVPYYDVPGRIASIRVYYNGKHRLEYKEFSRNSSKKHGMFMLGQIQPYSDIVIAVPDPLLAFRMHNRFANDGSKPPQIISYSDKTNCWGSVLCRRVVLWVDSLNIETLLHAKKADALVSLYNPIENYGAHLATYTGQTWKNSVMKSAVQWQRVVGDWLLRETPQVIQHTLGRLKLTSGERSEVLHAFADKDTAQERIKEIFDLQVSSIEVSVDNQRIVERNGKLYGPSPFGNAEIQISDAVVRLEKVISYEDDANYYVGHIHRAGRSAPFHISVEQANKGGTIKNWIENFCINNGLGCPVVSRRWGKHLLNIARAFVGPVPVDRRKNRVGWSEDQGSFMFPRVIVKDGQILQDDTNVILPGVPCSGIRNSDLGPNGVLSLLEDTELNATFWATLACMANNMAAPYFGHRCKKIGIVGETRFLNVIAEFMQLLSFNIATGRVSDVKNITALMKHDVPMHVSSVPDKRKYMSSWLNDGVEKNVMVSLTMEDALKVCGEDWLFINVPNTAPTVDSLKHCADLLPVAVIAIQRMTDGSDNTFVERFLGSLKRELKNGYLSHYTKDEISFKAVDAARTLISYGTPLSGSGFGDVFFVRLFEMFRVGEVTTSRNIRKFGKGKKILITDEAMVVPHNVLQLVSGSASLSLIGQVLNDAGILLGASDLGWSFDRAIWDKKYAEFQGEQNG